MVVNLKLKKIHFSYIEFFSYYRTFIRSVFTVILVEGFHPAISSLYLHDKLYVVTQKKDLLTNLKIGKQAYTLFRSFLQKRIIHLSSFLERFLPLLELQFLLHCRNHIKP